MKGPDADSNWDTGRRLAELEREGIVAEVIFPNTDSALLPEGLPRRAAAGTRTPVISRRDGPDCRLTTGGWPTSAARPPDAGPGYARSCSMISKRASRRSAGRSRAGLTGGVLLPGAPPGSGLPPLYDSKYYEPLWQVCEELGMPVNHHSGSAAPPGGEDAEDKVVLLLEVTWWAHRAFTHLLVSGAFERYPELQLVLTEQGTAWLPEELLRLDYFFGRMGDATASQELEWGLRSWAGSASSRASTGRASVISVRRSSVPTRSRSATRSASTGSCGAATTRTKKAATPTQGSISVRVSPVSHTRRSPAMLGRNAASVYGFDLERAAPASPIAFGPKFEEVDDRSCNRARCRPRPKNAPLSSDSQGGD